MTYFACRHTSTCTHRHDQISTLLFYYIYTSYRTRQVEEKSFLFGFCCSVFQYPTRPVDVTVDFWFTPRWSRILQHLQRPVRPDDLTGRLSFTGTQLVTSDRCEQFSPLVEQRGVHEARSHRNNKWQRLH